MCPACFANAAVVAGSVMSTGGVAAFAVKLVRRKKNEPAEPQTKSESSTDHRNEDQQ